ncbi:MAG TPA: Ku protein [Actinomycetaceae bacterium]|nr:Ku protein [Actinomycetaceae bacterium]
MRAIWKGSISFGLVNVPTSIYTATENHDLSLHQVHEKDGGRIRYQRRCEVCGQVVKWQDIERAYEDGGRTAIITRDDLETLPSEQSREIQILQFVPNEQIDPIMLDKSYYLAPSTTGVKPYVLLRRTLEAAERTAIVSFTLRHKTRLGALRVRDEVLVLQSMLWDDEIRRPDFGEIGADVQISEMELDMSSQLVDNYSADFRPEEFSDEYQEQLRALVSAKLAEGSEAGDESTKVAVADDGEDAEVVDLVEALRRSVSESKLKSKAKPRSTKKSSTEATSRSSASKRSTSTSGSGKKQGASTKRTAKKAGSGKKSA